MAPSLGDIFEAAAQRNKERRAKNRRLKRDELASQERRTKMRMKPQMQAQERKDREYWSKVRDRLGQEEADKRIYDVLAGNAPVEETVSQFSPELRKNFQSMVGGGTGGGTRTRGGGTRTRGGGTRTGQSGQGRFGELSAKERMSTVLEATEQEMPLGLRTREVSGEDRDMTRDEIAAWNFNVLFPGSKAQTQTPAGNGGSTDSQGRPNTAAGFLNNINKIREERGLLNQARREEKDKLPPGLGDFTVSGVDESGRSMGTADQSYKEWLEGGKQRPAMTGFGPQMTGSGSQGYLKFSDKPFEGEEEATPDKPKLIPPRQEVGTLGLANLGGVVAPGEGGGPVAPGPFNIGKGEKERKDEQEEKQRKDEQGVSIKEASGVRDWALNADEIKDFWGRAVRPGGSARDLARDIADNIKTKEPNTAPPAYSKGIPEKTLQKGRDGLYTDLGGNARDKLITELSKSRLPNLLSGEEKPQNQLERELMKKAKDVPKSFQGMPRVAARYLTRWLRGERI